MKSIATAAFLAAALLSVAQSAVAMDHMNGPMMAPNCAAGDHVVAMDTMKKMYMSSREAKMKMAGMSMSQQHAMMMKHHLKMMCKSQADMMGGKMMH